MDYANLPDQEHEEDDEQVEEPSGKTELVAATEEKSFEDTEHQLLSKPPPETELSDISPPKEESPHAKPVDTEAVEEKDTAEDIQPTENPSDESGAVVIDDDVKPDDNESKSDIQDVSSSSKEQLTLPSPAIKIVPTSYCTSNHSILILGCHKGNRQCMAFDIASQKYNEIEPYPTEIDEPAADHILCPLNRDGTQILSIGTHASPNSKAYRHFLVYDVTNNKWLTDFHAHNLKDFEPGLRACRVKNEIHVSSESQYEIWDMKTKKWRSQKEQLLRMPVSLLGSNFYVSSHALVYLKRYSRLLLFGGYNSKTRNSEDRMFMADPKRSTNLKPASKKPDFMSKMSLSRLESTVANIGNQTGWDRVPTRMPLPLSSFGYCVVMPGVLDWILVVGGRVSQGDIQEDSNKCYLFDIKNMNWVKLTRVLPVAMNSCSVVCDSSLTVHIIGGLIQGFKPAQTHYMWPLMEILPQNYLKALTATITSTKSPKESSAPQQAAPMKCAVCGYAIIEDDWVSDNVDTLLGSGYDDGSGLLRHKVCSQQATMASASQPSAQVPQQQGQTNVNPVYQAFFGAEAANYPEAVNAQALPDVNWGAKLLEHFLNQTCQMGDQYYDIFKAYGQYHSSILLDISEDEDLVEIGVTKRLHRRAILRHITNAQTQATQLSDFLRGTKDPPLNGLEAPLKENGVFTWDFLATVITSKPILQQVAKVSDEKIVDYFYAVIEQYRKTRVTPQPGVAVPIPEPPSDVIEAAGDDNADADADADVVGMEEEELQQQSPSDKSDSRVSADEEDATEAVDLR